MKINYYESEYFRIKLYNNKFKDTFLFDILENKIKIQRIDALSGWGQNLDIIIKDKLENTNYVINIGSSETNVKMIDFNPLNNNKNKYYFENEKYKIFYISEKYNDNFSVDYDENEKLLSLERIDSKEGWGQNLYVIYKEKEYPFKEKLINIGSSKIYTKSIKINLEDVNYLEKYNYFESENYIIKLHESKYLDDFLIIFYEETSTIFIKRMDSKDGWGQILKLEILNKINNSKNIIYIGNSIKNELYKKIDINPKKYYIALTTIPSRIKLPFFKENIEELLKYELVENIFITIAKKYKRFSEEIPNEIILYLQNIPKVIVIILEEDFGPASKYLGPLIQYKQLLENNVLIIVDDDRKYNKNLVYHFQIAYDSFPNITFSSGLWNEYFKSSYKNRKEDFLEIEFKKEENNNKFYFGQGVGGFFGFAIKISDNIEKFINYNFKIMNRIPKSIYHDEGIILGYLKYKLETIMYLKHKGCEILDQERIDALCTSNLVDRGILEKEIVQITNLEKLL